MNRVRVAIAIAVSALTLSACLVDTGEDDGDAGRHETVASEFLADPAGSDRHERTVAENELSAPLLNHYRGEDRGEPNFECRENICGPLCCLASERCQRTNIRPIDGGEVIASRYRCVSPRGIDPE